MFSTLQAKSNIFKSIQKWTGNETVGSGVKHSPWYSKEQPCFRPCEIDGKSLQAPGTSFKNSSWKEENMLHIAVIAAEKITTVFSLLNRNTPYHSMLRWIINQETVLGVKTQPLKVLNWFRNYFTQQFDNKSSS